MSFSSLVLVKGPESVLLVYEESKPTPHYWKCPGGGKRGSESPKMCASRELLEETGVTVSIDRLKRIQEIWRKDGYFVHFFVAEFPDGMPDHVEIGSDGEAVAEFSFNEAWRLLEQGKILPEHTDFIRQVLSECSSK